MYHKLWPIIYFTHPPLSINYVYNVDKFHMRNKNKSYEFVKGLELVPKDKSIP
jgi:hypothetical protein